MEGMNLSGSNMRPLPPFQGSFTFVFFQLWVKDEYILFTESLWGVHFYLIPVTWLWSHFIVYWVTNSLNIRPVTNLHIKLRPTICSQLYNCDVPCKFDIYTKLDLNRIDFWHTQSNIIMQMRYFNSLFTMNICWKI